MSNIENELEAAEAALDLVEDRLDDIIDNIPVVVRNNPYVLAGVALVAASAGATAAYFITKKRMSARFDIILENEIHEAKEFYSGQYKVDEFATPESTVEKLIPKEEQKPKKSKAQKEAERAMVDYSGLGKVSDYVDPDDGTIIVDETVVEEEVITSNIFVNGQPLNEDDYDENDEEALKSMGKPYVITEDAFGENEDGYEEMQVTWYEKDQVLADDRDEVIDDADDLVGEINMTKFGQGSGDKHVVFIQNDEKELVLEVARSRGSYAEEVAGLRHSDEDYRSSIRKFRGDDE